MYLIEVRVNIKMYLVEVYSFHPSPARAGGAIHPRTKKPAGAGWG